MFLVVCEGGLVVVVVVRVVFVLAGWVCGVVLLGCVWLGNWVMV